MSILVQYVWKIHISLIRLGLTTGFTMSVQKISFLLVLMLMIPLAHNAIAEGEHEPELEAKNLTAIVDLENETTLISWENINTNDYIVLTDLTLTNYSLYRSDEPLNSSNYASAQLVADQIQACLPEDSLTQCKEREHSVTFSIPPSTNGNFYYGVVSTLQNGTIINNFTVGNGALAQPVQEYGSPISSPYALQGYYDVLNSTTSLSWIDISTVDSTFSATHTTSIWSHTSPANRSNWNALVKTEIVSNLSSDVTKYHILHQQDVSRTMYYTVLHSFGNDTDSRLLSGNTLTQGILEDNTGSIITGELHATFDSATAMTYLDWNGSIIEDANHTLHVWRSPASITDLSASQVAQIAQLPGNSTHYNYSVESGYSGQTYYLITLSDQLGNQQSTYAEAPNAVVFEYTLLPEENIVDDISATFVEGATQITWTDLSNHPEATYQVWRSSVGPINTTSLSSDSVELLAVVESGVGLFNNTVAEGTSENAWYAVTVIASFGTQDVTYAQTNITMSYNSLMLPIVEDTTAPTAPLALDGEYIANGTTQLRWVGSVDESGTTWVLYRNLNTDLSNQAFWVQVGSAMNTGATAHTLYVNTVADEGELVSPVYAIGGVDAYGNTVDFSNWRLSDSVEEDRQKPQAKMMLFDASLSQESSRWFTGGEVATFSNLERGNYSIKFELSDDVASLTYTQSAASQEQILDLTQSDPHIDVAISEASSNITFSFTVTDNAGNVIQFDTEFCTTCLIEPVVVTEPVDSSNDKIEIEKTSDSDSNEMYLMVACAVLLLLVLVLLNRGSNRKVPKGLPTPEEDEWFANYVKD